MVPDDLNVDHIGPKQGYRGASMILIDSGVDNVEPRKGCHEECRRSDNGYWYRQNKIQDRHWSKCRQFALQLELNFSVDNFGCTHGADNYL